MSSNLKITFEIDNDGHLIVNGNLSTKSSFNVKGKMTLENDDKDLFNELKHFAKSLSSKCPSDFIYSHSSVSK